MTIVRPDAERMLRRDLPLLHLLQPWLDLPTGVLTAAIDDFSSTLRLRLDQGQQRLGLTRLAEDARNGGAFDAPACFDPYCTSGVLTTAWTDGEPFTDAIEPERAGRQLAAAWMWQAISGRVVPIEFDLADLWMRDGRLVLASGVFEAQTADERGALLRYLAAAAADDPDAAWDWIRRGGGARARRAVRVSVEVPAPASGAVSRRRGRRQRLAGGSPARAVAGLARSGLARPLRAPSGCTGAFSWCRTPRPASRPTTIRCDRRCTTNGCGRDSITCAGWSIRRAAGR